MCQAASVQRNSKIYRTHHLIHVERSQDASGLFAYFIFLCNLSFSSLKLANDKEPILVIMRRHPDLRICAFNVSIIMQNFKSNLVQSTK